MTTHDEPRLLFFRNRPSKLPDRPPLGSSLQSLESCLFFVALRRYPHALLACASAIESAIKAKFEISPGCVRSFLSLANDAMGKFRSRRRWTTRELYAFKEARNQIVHYGFSPKDDALAVDLLLRVGLPFLGACYKELFGYSLKQGLVEEVGSHLEVAIDVAVRGHGNGSFDITCSPIALGMTVGYHTRTEFMSFWEVHAAGLLDLDDSRQAATQRRESLLQGLAWEVRQKLRERWERELQPAAVLTCPVCHEIEALVCKLDENELDLKKVVLVGGKCAECGLLIPIRGALLLQTLCERQVKERSADILAEWFSPTPSDSAPAESDT